MHKSLPSAKHVNIIASLVDLDWYIDTLMSLFCLRTLQDTTGHGLFQLHSQSRMVRGWFAVRSGIVRQMNPRAIHQRRHRRCGSFEPYSIKIRQELHLLQCCRISHRIQSSGDSIADSRISRATSAFADGTPVKYSRMRFDRLPSHRATLGTAPATHPEDFALPIMSPPLSAAMLSRVRSDMLCCLSPTFSWLRRII